MNQHYLFLVQKSSGNIKEFDNVSQASKFLRISRQRLNEVLSYNDEFLLIADYDYINYERPDLSKLKMISGWFPITSWVDAYNLLPY